MDWSNEPYVRVYTRDTDDWLCLSWEARALWLLLLRRMDRAGLIETKRGARGLAVLAGMPPDVVERVLPELLEDGCLVAVEGGYVAPNYLAAQEAPRSDRQRARESRERRRHDAFARVADRHVESHTVTGGHEATATDHARDTASRNVTDESRNVTERHDPSHDVTDGHGASQRVTLTSADPDLTLLGSDARAPARPAGMASMADLLDAQRKLGIGGSR